MSESDRPPGPGLDDLDAVYARELDYVWQTLGRLGVAPADLPDAAHDTFLVVHQRWAELDRSRPIRAWLFGIARRVAAAARRKRAELPTADVEHLPAHRDDALAARDLLWKALAQLDDDRRDVIVLHDLEGRTGREIAEILGVPANTVHSRLRLGRAELLAALERLQRGPR